MEAQWFFVAGVLLGAIIMFLNLKNKRTVSEVDKLRKDISCMHDRLIDVISRWQVVKQ